LQVHLTTLIGGGAGGANRQERRRRGEGGAENEANRSLAKMQSNGSRNGASGDWAARRGSRKQSEAVGAPGCVSSGRPTPSRKADPETAGGRLLTEFVRVTAHYPRAGSGSIRLILQTRSCLFTSLEKYNTRLSRATPRGKRARLVGSTGSDHMLPVCPSHGPRPSSCSRSGRTMCRLRHVYDVSYVTIPIRPREGIDTFGSR